MCLASYSWYHVLVGIDQCDFTVVVYVASFLPGVMRFFFFFKQKPAYAVRISDWSSDVCSSDLAAAAGTSLGFGIRRADKDIEQLKQQVVQDFSRLILAPYDQMLGTDLARGEAGLEHALAVAQRLRLLEDCRRSREECARAERLNNVVFDPASRLFAPFQSGEADVRIDRQRANALFSTYLGYLQIGRAH